MPDTYQPSPIDRWYYWRHLGPKLLALAGWSAAYFGNGGQLPATREGIVYFCALVFIILYDGKTSISGAGKVAPPKGGGSNA